MTRKLLVVTVAVAVIAALAGVGWALRARASGAPSAVPTMALPASEPTPSPSPSPTPSPSPSPTETTPSPSPTPTEPAFRYDVAAAQQKLVDMGYYGGPVDGEAGAAMRSAVMAFQKVNGLSADGIVGPLTLAALDAPVAPQLAASSPPTRIEVDLTKQVLYYVEGGQLVRIMPVSSGSGATYRTASGGTARSLTPVGWYKVQRRISGLREAPLGSLYDPMYFYKGWALHGSNSVPAYPASHGCIRLTRWDALWLFPRAPVGTHVYVYGGTHTFPAGSSAPGTDTPAGDTAEEPSPSPTPTENPSPSTSDSPSPSPSESDSPSPSPSPSDDGDLPTELPDDPDSGSPSDSESPSESDSPSETGSSSESPSPSDSSS